MARDVARRDVMTAAGVSFISLFVKLSLKLILRQVQ